MAIEINGRENQLAIFRHEKPARIPRSSDTCWLRWPGDTKYGPGNQFDWWGILWLLQPDGGSTLDETRPRILTDLEKWREQVKVPDPYTCGKWPEEGIAATAKWDRENQVGAMFMHMGHFERLQTLMGFENAICAFYDEDYEDELHELFEAITDYKLKCLRITKEYINPDIVVYQDDWGMERSMFFSPDIWHKWIKPELKKIVDECHRLGMYFEMHSCGHVQEVVGALVDEVGIDSIQTLQYPANDIRMIKREYGDRLVIRGGYDGQTVLREDVSDDVIRERMRESLEVLVPGGNHIPFFYPFGSGAPRALRLFAEEIEKYENEHGCC